MSDNREINEGTSNLEDIKHTKSEKEIIKDDQIINSDEKKMQKGNNEITALSNEQKTIQTKNNDLNKSNQIDGHVPLKSKPLKELPIEKKPFKEFINDYLIPQMKEDLQKFGKKIVEIKLENNIRPIAGDKCWYIYCSIQDTCNFWLSFEKDDITSLKSFTLSRFNEKPSVLESFLIDERKITLKLIISRILQRLNGQKLLGIN